MTRVDGLNSHRWIILLLLHVAFILQRNANAQSLSPSSDELQPPGHASTKTTVYALLVTVFFLIGLLSFHIHRCTQPIPEYPGGYFRRRDDECSQRGSLENAVVESFPVFAYSSVKESKIGSNNLECAICLNKFEDCETVRLLPICNHLFHIDCIDAWLYSHPICPVCRSDLTAKSVKIEDSPVRDQVVIDIEDVVLRPSSEISGKFPRSNSTGHSVNQLSDGAERFTLRLPEDVKRRIVTAKRTEVETNEKLRL